MVDEGGTLELHGKKKLSWTKLSKTAQKLENSGEILYDHLVSIIRLSSDLERVCSSTISRIGSNNYATSGAYRNSFVFFDAMT